MKESKFRVFIKSGDQKIQNHLIGKILKENECVIREEAVYVSEWKRGVWQHRFNYSQAELMQYAGFKDYAGNDAYEGDIIKKDEKTFELCVEYGSFILKSLCGEVCFLNMLGEFSEGCKFCEIIGNIYQNPELLTLEKEKS